LGVARPTLRSPHHSPGSLSRYLPISPAILLSPPSPSPRIAVAQDPAFSFYNPDNLDILRTLGAELVPWSPLKNEHLPADIDGLYFGGGFPEMFAAELAANQGLLAQLKTFLDKGLPAYAECGGLMYLATTLIDLEDQSWPMVGAIPTIVRMTGRLTLGYRRAIAQQSGLLVAPEQALWGHEFHRSQTDTLPENPLYQFTRYGAAKPHATEGWSLKQIQASYLHLHWGGCPEVAQALVTACGRYCQKYA
ncbi:MAG: cobyrinic acid a,c-diamide synthase, partial [Cyanobacteria bacterium J06638_6]